MMDFFEVVHTQRAIRRFTDDPVPDDLVHRLLDAARKAPSPTNAQPWSFVVVRDGAARKTLAEMYARAWSMAQTYYGDPAKARDETERRMLERTDELARGLDRAPVFILVCLDRSRLGPLVTPDLQHILDPPSAYGSVWAAAQNLMLAARALGLGTVPTNLHRASEAELKQMLEIPDHVEIPILVALGWPAMPFGPTSRDPVERVAFAERWGRPFAP